MSRRYRLSDEEAELINDMRSARIREAVTRGGQLSGKVHGERTQERTRPKKAKAGSYAKPEKSHKLTSEDAAKGGKTTQERNAKIMGIAAITNEIRRRGISEPDDTVDVVAGDLRPDVIAEVTSAKTGIISDLHWPFHALTMNGKDVYGPYMTAIEYLRDQGIGTLIVNGDAMDCYNVSTHERTEAKRNFAWELDVARGMVAHLRKFFGDKVRIIYREGNHEERWQRYIARNADQLAGVPEVALAELLRLRSQGVDWVGERSKLTIGKLWIDHGHEWFGSGGVNPARAYRMKAQDNILVGHVHKTTFDMHKRPLDGSFFAGWSMGCLCDLNPHYAPRNHWNHGVAMVHLDATGEFTLENRIIINNRIR